MKSFRDAYIFRTSCRARIIGDGILYAAVLLLLIGKKIYIFMDHNPLVWLHSVQDSILRLKNWYFKLWAVYNFDIQHVLGKTNYIAEALSRNPASIALQVNIVRKRRQSTLCSGSKVMPVSKRKGKALQIQTIRTLRTMRVTVTYLRMHAIR